MRNRLLQVLSRAPGPQTAADLHGALRREGLKAEQFEVVRTLRKLQEEGLVRLAGARWRLIRPMGELRPSGLPDPPTEGWPEGPLGGRLARSADGRTGTEACGRWAQFRAMCRYYMDCLMQDEAPSLRAYVENENDTWLLVPEVPWARLTARKGFALPLRREHAGFQRNRARRGEEECVHLCYPVVLVRPVSGSTFIVPMFALPMLAEWRSGVLDLEPDGAVTVNGAWLEYQFRRRAERVAFLRAMGLVGHPVNDDEGESAPAAVGRDLASLAQDAAHYIFREGEFAEDVRPNALNRGVSWHKARPGLYNAAVLVLGPRMRYTRSLWRELQDISERLPDEELDRTALAALFPHIPPASEGRRSSGKADVSGAGMAVGLADEDVIHTRFLHPSQRSAVVNALSEPVSIVTGPPGTGKSEVVAAILLNELVRGRPALLGSRNHQALEAVLPRLNQAGDGGELLIRASGRDANKRQNYTEKLRSLLAIPQRLDAARGEEFQEAFAELFTRQGRLAGDLERVQEARREYEALNGRLAEVRERLPIWARRDETLREWPKHATAMWLEAREREVARAFAPPSGLFEHLCRRLRGARFAKRRERACEPLRSLPIPFRDRNWPNDSSDLNEWKKWFAAWKSWAEAAEILERVRLSELELSELPTAEFLTRDIAAGQEALEELTRAWMQWAGGGGVSKALGPADREALANLRAGIQNWGARRFASELKRHFPQVLRAFPLWSVSNLSARTALPLVPAMFDLVIVDEASQCDIPSVIPLLARSRRAVLVGDPMQLRHISMLDAAIDQVLLTQHGLTEANVQRFSYRVNSAFDLAEGSSAVPAGCRVRLDLHFRSHEAIAEYCNEAFYGKTLHVVTATERLRIPRGMRPGIHWTHVAGSMERAPSGAWCGEEVRAVCDEVERIASAGFDGTIGVVTPFKHQMIRIRDALESCEGVTMEFRDRVKLMVDTANGFQGDERDLVLFSLCGGPDLPDGGKHFLRDNPNLFNVAVSRARAVLHVFGNRDWALTCGVPFIEKLARRLETARHGAQSSQEEAYQSPWEKVMAEALKAAGVEVIPQYPVAGRFLDLAILGPRKVDVEIDGESVHRTAGGARKDDDYWRDLQLQSLGWTVCRFWVYEIRENPDACVHRVLERLRSEREENAGGSHLVPGDPKAPPGECQSDGSPDVEPQQILS